MAISLRFQFIPPDENQLRGQIEYMKDEGNKAPPRRPGDKYTIAGALVGIIVGIIIAGISRRPWVFIVAPIGGGIAGAVLGSLAGNLIKKFRESRNNLTFC